MLLLFFGYSVNICVRGFVVFSFEFGNIWIIAPGLITMTIFIVYILNLMMYRPKSRPRAKHAMCGGAPLANAVFLHTINHFAYIVLN